MAQCDYSRANIKDFKVLNNTLFNALLTFSRSDGEAIVLTGKSIKMDVYDKLGGTLIVSYDTDTEITINSATQITISVILSGLSVKGYTYLLYNDTDSIGLGRGKLIVE